MKYKQNVADTYQDTRYACTRYGTYVLHCIITRTVLHTGTETPKDGTCLRCGAVRCGAGAAYKTPSKTLVQSKCSRSSDSAAFGTSGVLHLASGFLCGELILYIVRRRQL